MVNPRQYYKTQEQALADAIKAGIGQVLAFLFNVPKLAKQGLDDHLLTEADIDAVLRGKFRTVIRLGLLDPPAMVPYASIGGAGEPEPWTTGEAQARGTGCGARIGGAAEEREWLSAAG